MTAPRITSSARETPVHGWRRHARRQRGSLLIQLAVFMGIAVLILGVVDMGYAFYAKRDLQRIADLAAVEAVQGIDPTNPQACIQAGDRSVQSNWPAPISPGQRLVECGEWSIAKHAAPQYFQGNAADVNAARVTLEGDSPRFIPSAWSRRVRVVAIAQRAEPAVAFQVGSQLLNLNPNAMLGKLLTTIGLDADKLTLLDANGLVNAKISPSGLLKALGVDLGIEGLAVLTSQQVTILDNLSMLQILNASLDVISDDILKADLRAAINVMADLKIEGVRLLDMKIPLLGDSSAGTPGIFTFVSLGATDSPSKAALDAQVSVGAVLNTAIMLAAHGHALQIKETSLLNAVKLGLTVVAPPTIAGGPIGTRANSSQVRLNLDIDSTGIPLVGPLLNALGFSVNLPIKIDSVSAEATLAGVHCPDPARQYQPSIDLDVDTHVSKITIGHADLAADNAKNILINTPLFKVRGPITAKVLENQEESFNLIKQQAELTKVNELLLGNTLDSLTNAIFNLLGGLFSPVTLNQHWQGLNLDGNAEDIKNAQIEILAKFYLEETKVNGLYNVDNALNLMLNGKGAQGTDGYIGKLVSPDFTFNNAIPAYKCGLLGLVLCESSAQWTSGTFSQAFKNYTTTMHGTLGLLIGTPLDGGYYTACAGLLSALTSWNSCVFNNLKNLIKRNSAHPNIQLSEKSDLIASLQNASTADVTCNGALCVLLKPLLTPIKALLNGVGKALLAPLLNDVLGLQLGRSEVKALDINCNAAELVY